MSGDGFLFDNMRPPDRLAAAQPERWLRRLQPSTFSLQPFLSITDEPAGLTDKKYPDRESHAPGTQKAQTIPQIE
jgi:hypothetical protein